jgi:histidyl-tRNA synthetase
MERKAEIPLEQLVCVVLPVSEKVIEEGLKITRILRNAGISTEFDLMGRSLKRAISYADARGARYVVIVGEKDLAEGKITLRDMRTGDQEIIARQELIERLKPWRALG